MIFFTGHYYVEQVQDGVAIDLSMMEVIDNSESTIQDYYNFVDCVRVATGESQTLNYL